MKLFKKILGSLIFWITIIALFRCMTSEITTMLGYDMDKIDGYLFRVELNRIADIITGMLIGVMICGHVAKENITKTCVDLLSVVKSEAERARNKEDDES